MALPRPRLASVLLGALLAACGDPAAPAVAGDRERDPGVIRVAVWQLGIDADPAVNLDRIEGGIAAAAATRADLVCFPEASVFGWVNPTAHDEATPIPGATTERIGAVAARYGVMVALGLAEKDGAQLHNAAVLIGADGALLLKHRKVNVLTELMDPPYAAGTGTDGAVVETRFGRIGMLICADTFEETLVDGLAAQRPDLVIVPYGWAAPANAWPGHGESLRAWVTNTARRCDAPVVGVDSTGALHHGPWKGYVLGGQSVVSDAKGEVIDVLADRVPDMRVFELDLRRDRVNIRAR